jgi:hypothetical protein
LETQSSTLKPVGKAAVTQVTQNSTQKLGAKAVARADAAVVVIRKVTRRNVYGR